MWSVPPSSSAAGWLVSVGSSVVPSSPHAAATRLSTATAAITLSARFKATPLLMVPFSHFKKLTCLRGRPPFAQGPPLSIRSDSPPRIEGVAKAVPHEVERQRREEQSESREDHQPRCE